ncbi:hypothetical protein KCU73_g3013, partial [Aureobasidium melanogenum]
VINLSAFMKEPETCTDPSPSAVTGLAYHIPHVQSLVQNRIFGRAAATVLENARLAMDPIRGLKAAWLLRRQEMELLQRELIRANEEMRVWEREHDWVSMRNELPALAKLDELFEILWSGVDEDYKRCQQAIQGSSSDVGASVDRD